MYTHYAIIIGANHFNVKGAMIGVQLQGNAVLAGMLLTSEYCTKISSNRGCEAVRRWVSKESNAYTLPNFQFTKEEYYDKEHHNRRS